METRLAIFSMFIVLLLFLYVIVWLPFINGLATEVHQTKRILLLIPIELLVSMKQVSMLLQLMTSSPKTIIKSIEEEEDGEGHEPSSESKVKP
jgi:hypothetical protein